MIWIDYAIVGVLVVGATIGLARGMARQLFFLLATLCGLLVGLWFSREFSHLLPASIKDPNARLAVALLGLNFITALLGRTILLLLGDEIKRHGLTLAERAVGSLLGLLQAGLWLTLLMILAGLSLLPQSPWWHKAKCLPPIESVAIWLKAHIPSSLLDAVHYH